MKHFLQAILLLALIIGCKKEKKEVPVLAMIPQEEPVIERFGFNFEEFEVVQDTIKSGDSFGELMLKNRAEYPKVVKIANEFKDTFDVRYIKTGKPYFILKSKDTAQAAQVFIYQNDPINYTVVDLRDSVTAYKKQKEIKYVDREISGIIRKNSSLSEVLMEQHIDYNVCLELSDIYAWSIDFFKLQEGDRFKAVYREKYINDSIYAGYEPIKASYFQHKGEPFYAFAYGKDSLTSQNEYFNDKAKNLRSTFLKAPLKFGRISSRFNLKRRIKYYGYKIRPHRGTDYAAPIGTPILATANGVVTESTRRGGNGKFVKIKHNGTYSTQYLHMRKQNVRKGDLVKQGDVIGWVGMTGNTGGPHVCYRFWKNGVQVDPLREKLPAAEPIADSLRTDYLKFIEPIKGQLDCITYPEEEAPIEKEDNLITLNHKNGTSSDKS